MSRALFARDVGILDGANSKGGGFIHLALCLPTQNARPGVYCGLTDMKHKLNEQRHHTAHTPKFQPTGSFTRVLLTGGKNLTMFQSVGLAIFGVCVALGVGVPALVIEFSWESTFGRMGYRYRDVSMLFFGIATILWGLTMITNGLLGVARRMLRGKQP
jgi:hypothetical protein